MANIDTLAYYEQLRAAGNNELEAKAHVYALSEGVSDLVNKDDLHKEMGSLEQRLGNKIDVSVATLKTLGWSLFVAIVVPGMKLAFWP